MSLEELEKKLYQREKGEAIPIRKTESPPSPQGEMRRAGANWGVVPETKSPFFGRGLKLGPPMWKIASFAVGFLIVITAGFFVFRYFFTPPQLQLNIDGPQEIIAGIPATYTITLDNKAQSALNNASFTFRTDSGVEFQGQESQSVIQRGVEGSLDPGTTRKELVSLIFWGKPGDQRNFSVTFRYLLGNLSAPLEENKSIQVTIAQPAVSLNLALPNQVIPGDKFTFTIGWQNSSQVTLASGKVGADLPDGVTLADASPKPDQPPSLWLLQNIAQNASGTISLTAQATGAQGEAKRFHIYFMIPVRGEDITLQAADASLSLVENPLALAISVNNQDASYIASLSNALTYQISYKNTFDIPLNDVVITAKLDSPLFDTTSVQTSGTFSSRDNTITWNGGNTPQLLAVNPSETGTVSFAVQIKPRFVDKTAQNLLKATVDISSPTKPPSLGGSKIVTAETTIANKVQAQLMLTTKVLHNDPVAPFTNSGPIPPRVNQTTQYAAHIKLSAAGNDIRDINVKTVLPNNATFVGRTGGQISGTQFLFNPRTNEIDWTVPRVAAFTSREIIIKLAATPSLPQAGKLMTILDEVGAQGTDDFTSNTLMAKSNAIDSSLPDDPSIGSNGGIVQP